MIQATEQHLESLVSVLNGDYNLKGDGAISRLDFRRLPGPVFDPPRRETAGRVTR